MRRTTRMHCGLRALALLALAALLGASGAVRAADAADADAVDAEAMARLQQMAAAISKAKSLRVEITTSYDVVQPNGQQIEFGGTRKVAIRRPDRARIDTVSRDGSRRGLIFDGKQIAIFDLDEGVYASVDKPGTTDAAFDYYTGELGMQLPLGELFAVDLPKSLREWLVELELVEEETLGGVACDHFAGRSENVDLQLWIDQGEKPLPRRVVLTYRDAPGQPQFRADLSGWDLAATLGDELFAFTPPATSEKIPFAPRPAAATGPGEQ